MQNEGGVSRDMSRTWDGRRRAAARERLRKAAEVLAGASQEHLSAYAQQIVVRAGKRALVHIEAETNR